MKMIGDKFCTDSETTWKLFKNDFRAVLHDHAPLKVFTKRGD